jgi:uncharacterized protein YidB (DUF937 family)
MTMANTNTMLKALLGLAVVAGWQNRDKISDFVKNMGSQSGSPAGGLGGLVESFKKAGLGEHADSWVGTGANKPITPTQVEQGVGSDMLDELAKQTGVSKDDLLKRLQAVLPELVNQMMPNGKLPG